MAKKLLPVALLGLLLTGCVSTITNLTPKQESRNPNGFYPVEVAFTSTQQSLRWESIHPTVVVGKDFYPMRFTPLMTNRWETLIPAPLGANSIAYRFKIDYTYNAFGSEPKQNSKLSPIYRLEIK